jgi:hypothetical protein
MWLHIQDDIKYATTTIHTLVSDSAIMVPNEPIRKTICLE